MFGREIGEEAGHGKPVSVQWDKANDTHLLRSSSLIDSDALYPEPDALDLYHPPIYAFATNMVNNGEPLLNILQMLSSFGMSREATRSILQEVWLEPAINWAESHAKRSVAAGWYTDAENDFEGLTEAHIASSYVNEQLFDENAQNRDLSDHDRESDHQTDGKKKHKHRTNDAREHAPNTAHPGWGYGGIGGLLVCPQCMGSGCGHCAGSGQVTQEQASTPTQPLTDQTPDQTQDAGSASTSGGVSASLKTADYSVNDPLSGGGGQGYVVPPQHSNSQNPASTGWATSQDPGDWGRSLISNDFGVTFDASLHTAKSSSPQEGPTVSGVALKAADTGRVLMIQRSMKDESDPAKGTWEFPGGHHEEGDQTSLHAGIREWQEETGQPFPDGGHVTHVHRTGPYNLHTVVIPEESQVKFHEGRSLDNPDDPDGDDHENAAWWEPDHAKKNPALRDELKGHPSWGDIKRAASVKTASNWDMFDNNHSYRAGHQAGGKGDFSQVDEIERWRKPGHPVSDHDADYLLGHQHGLDAARESAEGNHRMKKLFEEAPEYNSVEHQVDMLGHELDRHSSLETDDISLDSVMSVYTTLHDDPEAALPSTDGAEDVQGSILAGNSVDGPHDTDDAQHIVEAFLASKGAAVIANGDKELMAKVAMKDFNHAEQQELINEGMGDRARNFGDLKIAGTHYEKLPEDDSDNLWFL
jgi:8-oxo-dGTP pyrophosphatase MutT (NUDIX family)